VTIKIDASSFSQPVFSVDNRWLASQFPSSTKVWDVKTGVEVLDIKESARPIVFSADGQHLVSIGPGGLINVWDIKAGKAGKDILLKEQPTAPGFTSIALSPDGKRLATVIRKAFHKLAELRIWDSVTGRQVSNLELEVERLAVLASSPDGRRLAASFDTGGLEGGGRSVKVWDTANGKVVANPPFRSVHSLTFTPDGKRLALASADAVEILDSDSGKPMLSFKSRATMIYRLVFSPSGERLAYCSQTLPAIAVHDALTGKELCTLPSGEDFSFSRPVFSPDGRWVATSTPSGRKVWDVATGHEIFTIKEHGSVSPQQSGPYVVGFIGPEGKLLVSWVRAP
jgi:WD40 repeat protein